MTRCDVCVVGGGVVGLFTAYFAAKKGHIVSVLERGRVASEASRFNAGFVVPEMGTHEFQSIGVSQALRWLFSPSSPIRVGSRQLLSKTGWILSFMRGGEEQNRESRLLALKRLANHSINMLEQVIARENIECDYIRRGVVEAYRTEREFRQAADSVRNALKEGSAVEIVEDPSALPTHLTNVYGAIYYKNDAALSPDKLTQALAQVLREQGVNIIEETEASAFHVDGSRIYSITTRREQIKAEAFALTAGPWTDQLLSLLGLDLRLMPAKGYVVMLDSRDMKHLEIPVMFREDGVAVNQADINRVRATGFFELVGYDKTASPARLEQIRRVVVRHIPALAEQRHWKQRRPSGRAQQTSFQQSGKPAGSRTSI